MIKSVLVSLILMNAATAYAGEAENIMACVNRANEFSGIKLSEFDAKYEGRILSMSSAKWSNAFCEVKFGTVNNLQVNGNQFIYNGFAGKEAYDLNKMLENKTESAINQLRSRISLLEQRMSQVKRSLQTPKPNVVSLTQYINEGIEKSIGVERQAAASIILQTQDITKVAPPPNEVSPVISPTPSEYRPLIKEAPSVSMSVSECINRGITYFKEIGSYPTLGSSPNAGRSAEDVARERCGRTTSAF